ncbi:putative transcriptional regulator [Halohasta litchfieldiae]|jgi:DNA-binding transcriptional ArsR family regulator|uniref:Helix-turn-helix domain-containing protein n=1 Tax=Halohasta litchfieldiae TaxID=1073996 RepID=A0A1H6Y456_9EURY|nr:helix-turn-helix domain-containing protein [Halohasta litchfieldiae]ATW86860.1 putative transcriptional regulator [Halohasta litchfieldiae]SEJ31910.1 Helix-turn-helix domain-containing protein [Halohasta litchfieldiae]
MVHDPSARDDEYLSEDVLSTLGDEPTRTIIETLSEPMTATELSEACDIPQSTMYRKLDQLTEASLVTESTQIRESGQHTTRYELDFDEIAVQLSEEHTLTTKIDRPARESTADQRLEELWAQIREGT